MDMDMDMDIDMDTDMDMDMYTPPQSATTVRRGVCTHALVWCAGGALGWLVPL